ncbi:hypothetical protein ABB27_09005 [Stenotrophomonas terrae]|uniref:DUF4124 domain-containing protein n=1 Tax=Stenotrophomonas terrae TaxID=405446 RepID=A0A0R0CQ27_9GAMM|nr:hypothetical protein [Stenotrophomonas terrae]KRG67745.1 hypothetical protein ABB27_09005 [Stenotrophomonas terrae]
MLSFLLLLVAAAGIGAAAAQGPAVYKCREGGGVSYQSAPCAGRELKRWAATPESVDAAAELRLQAVREQLSKRQAGSPATAARSVRRQPAAPRAQDPCERARKGRDKAYAKAGLKRDFAMSSVWDNKVQQACR